MAANKRKKRATPGSYYGLRKRVAELTKLSTLTVTYVLQGRNPNSAYTEETREKVLKAAERVKRQIEKSWSKRA